MTIIILNIELYRTVLDLFSGGGSRIRTHGALTLNGFQDRRLKPLGHPSDLEAFLSTILVKKGQYGFKFETNATRSDISLFELPSRIKVIHDFK